MFFVAEVAQLVEHSTENAGVVSSILTLGTFPALLVDRFRWIWLVTKHAE